ncbi:MAG: STAS domain-containing protein [Chloroflexi bacterium]|nr:STAS domain-containing protein [Chloroflexota bacterium]MBU1749442.1 STAS domain-containing protein [Chloroflexota bacterium]
MTEREICVVCPQGRIDAATAPQLEADLRQHIVDGRLWLVVDLAQVRYLSSSALKVLLVTLRQVRQHGGDIRLAALQDRVYDIFEMAGFHRLFAIDESVPEAQAALRAALRAALNAGI